MVFDAWVVPFILGVLELWVSTGPYPLPDNMILILNFVVIQKFLFSPSPLQKKIVLAIIPLSNPSVSTSIIFFYENRNGKKI